PATPSGSMRSTKREDMREVHVRTVADHVRRLCVLANHEIREDHIAALQRGLVEEQSPLGCQVLRQLLKNADVAATERVAFCQGTGYAVVFLKVGQDVHFVGCSPSTAIDQGVRGGYREGFGQVREAIQAGEDRTVTRAALVINQD
ncbi:MAG: fumarate hydratase, partial [Actinomycetota bacterium]|nr:fumarate hydratase [Actinomycetota bacterium]